MKMVKSLGFLRGALACASVAGAAAALTAVAIAPVRADGALPPGTPDPAKTISISLTDAPVRTALQIVFQSAGLNYTVDPAVNGIISSINLRGVSFKTALQSVLRSVTPPLEADEDPDTGVYYIRVKSDTLNQPGANPDNPAYPQQYGNGAGTPGQLPGALQTQTTATDTSGVSLSNYETIQVNYADVRLLIMAGILGQPSTVLPATSQMWGSGTNGNGRNGNSGNSGMNGNSGNSGMNSGSSFGNSSYGSSGSSMMGGSSFR